MKPNKGDEKRTNQRKKLRNNMKLNWIKKKRKDTLKNGNEMQRERVRKARRN